MEVVLPQAGYSIAEVERILGIPTKTGYRLLKSGKLSAYVDSSGQLRVSQMELYAYMKTLDT